MPVYTYTLITMGSDSTTILPLCYGDISGLGSYVDINRRPHQINLLLDGLFFPCSSDPVGQCKIN